MDAYTYLPFIYSASLYFLIGIFKSFLFKLVSPNCMQLFLTLFFPQLKSLLFSSLCLYLCVLIICYGLRFFLIYWVIYLLIYCINLFVIVDIEPQTSYIQLEHSELHPKLMCTYKQACTIQKPQKWTLHDLRKRFLLQIREREHPKVSGRVHDKQKKKQSGNDQGYIQEMEKKQQGGNLI